MSDRGVNDLNSRCQFRQSSGAILGGYDVQRQSRFLATHGVPRATFAVWWRLSRRFNVRTFSCRDQFLSMAFAQLTFRESLRDIETCLRAQPRQTVSRGFRGQVSRSTLADANESRDWRIYADFAQVLIRRARRLYARSRSAWNWPDGLCPRLDDDRPVFELFPWAKFRRPKGPSSCTRCSTCAAASRVLCTFPTGKCTM